jgi:hypothetical protein
MMKMHQLDNAVFYFFGDKAPPFWFCSECRVLFKVDTITAELQIQAPLLAQLPFFIAYTFMCPFLYPLRKFK